MFLSGAKMHYEPDNKIVHVDFFSFIINVKLNFALTNLHLVDE